MNRAVSSRKERAVASTVPLGDRKRRGGRLAQIVKVGTGEQPRSLR